MSEIQNKVVIIGNTSVDTEKVIFTDQDGVDYTFKFIKLDGTPSKAGLDWRKFKAHDGDTYEIGFTVFNGKKYCVGLRNVTAEQTKALPAFSSNGEQFNKQQERIGKAMTEKRDNIKWLNAVNNATLLISNGLYPVGESVVITVEFLAKQIYGIKQPE